MSAPFIAPANGDEPPDVSRFFRPLDQVKVGIHPQGPVPEDKSQHVFHHQESSQAWARSVAETHVHWRSANLHHETLYFQELMLERHGVSVAPRVQPLISAAHFFGVVSTMPYRLAIDRPREIVYTWGQGQPGSTVPSVREQLPWETDAALLQSAAVATVLLMAP